MTPELINPDELVERYRGHTPGPWEVYFDGHSIAAKDGHIVSTWVEGNTGEEAQANARLIADAPTLLARIKADAATIERLTTALDTAKCRLEHFEHWSPHARHDPEATVQGVIDLIAVALSPNPDGGR